jgi:hypothetical protein
MDPSRVLFYWRSDEGGRTLWFDQDSPSLGTPIRPSGCGGPETHAFQDAGIAQRESGTIPLSTLGHGPLAGPFLLAQ